MSNINTAQMLQIIGMMYDITVELACSRTYGIPYDWIEEHWDVDLSDKTIQDEIREVWTISKHMDLISDMDFDNTHKTVYVMIWETGRGNDKMNNVKRYTLKDYKQFCDEALIMPPFEDDEHIDEWFATHKIHIIANDCIMELDYDADAVNEIEFGLKEIHEAILGSGEPTTGNTVGTEYRAAELKDLVRFFILRECENWGNLDWIGYAERAVKELSDIKTLSEVWKNALDTRKAWVDILKCNFEKFNLVTLKDATEEGIKKIILNLVGSNIEVSYDPRTDKSFLIDYTFSESGIFIDWSWGQVNEDEIQNMITICRESMF